jgi:flagellar hook-length control protein FliK
MYQTQQEINENAQIFYAAEIADQTDVTYILEGDKKSTIVPESMYEAKDALITEQKPEEAKTEQTPKPEPEITARDVKTAYHNSMSEKAADTASTASTDVKAEKQDGPETKSFEAYMQKQQPSDNTEISKGEVGARMPTSETLQGNENSVEKPKYTTLPDNGDLSHLENASDNKEVKGEKFELRQDKGQENQSGAGETAYGAAHLETEVKSQSIRGNAQMQQETPDTPVTKENLFDEMVSRINVMQQDVRQEMTIQLKPEFLGNLSLQVAIENGGLHVRIDASDAGVRGLVGAQMQQLIQELEAKGLTVVEVEVSHTGIDNGDFNQQSGGYGQGGGRSHKSYNGGRAEENASIIKHAIELHEYYVEAGVSSVQYSA